jgi:hypothetical protein
MTLLIALWIWSMPQAPGPGVAAVKPDVLEQISCAPMGLAAPPVAGLRVLGGTVHGRIMFGPGDALVVNAGTLMGVQRGQRYFVRRPITDASTKPPKVGALYGVHTAGWVTIVNATDTTAVATVTHACDGVLEGDYLQPYADPVLPPAAVDGTPDFAHPGRIVMADERRQSGYPGLAMLMNRGTDEGVRAGLTLTIYRPTLDGQGPNIDIGRATVLSATPRSALLRVDTSRDAVYVGDLVAIHRTTQ